MLLQSYEEGMKFFGDFRGHSVLSWPTFFKLQSTSIFVFRGNRQNWNIIFRIQLMEKHFLAFYKDDKEGEIPLLTDFQNKMV